MFVHCLLLLLHPTAGKYHWQSLLLVVDQYITLILHTASVWGIIINTQFYHRWEVLCMCETSFKRTGCTRAKGKRWLILRIFKASRFNQVLIENWLLMQCCLTLKVTRSRQCSSGVDVCSLPRQQYHLTYGSPNSNSIFLLSALSALAAIRPRLRTPQYMGRGAQMRSIIMSSCMRWSLTHYSFTMESHLWIHTIHQTGCNWDERMCILFYDIQL